MAQTKADYVEFPFDHIVAVHWAEVTGTVSLNVFLEAELAGNNDIDADTTSQMNVAVSGFVPLRSTTLEVGSPDVYHDQVIGPMGFYGFDFALKGEFPKRIGLRCQASHSITGSRGKSFSISVSLQTPGIFSGHFEASATSSHTPFQSLSGEMGNTQTVTARLTLDPPSLSLG